MQKLEVECRNTTSHSSILNSPPLTVKIWFLDDETTSPAVMVDYLILLLVSESCRTTIEPENHNIKKYNTNYEEMTCKLYNI